MSGHEACLLEDYVNSDSDLPVCVDLEDNTWESTFFAHLGQEEEEASEDEENDDQQTIDAEPAMKVKTYKEANEFLEA